MRHLSILILTLLAFLISCKSKKTSASSKNESLIGQLCPTDGVCKLEVFKNKILQVKADEFSEIYTELTEGNRLVLKFEYKKNEELDVQDGSYREEVFIELDQNNLELETTNLLDKKLYFARWCFCRGETGYYKINKGQLSVKKKSDNTYHLHLDFQIDDVPQIIKNIDQTFSIE